MEKVDAPVSRAYYKLHQVFDDHLKDILPKLRIDNGAGLDLGASPGGWTQVLHQNGLRPVVAIDPGLLAPRVQTLDGVQHVQGDFSSEESIQAIANAAPYSAIVCDANLYLEIFKQIAQTLEGVAKVLRCKERSLLAFPSVFVLTIKFPYKTEESLRRNLAWASEQIPACLQRIVDAAASLM